VPRVIFIGLMFTDRGGGDIMETTSVTVVTKLTEPTENKGWPLFPPLLVEQYPVNSTIVKNWVPASDRGMRLHLSGRSV
jgi:hypothetical protein